VRDLAPLSDAELCAEVIHRAVEAERAWLDGGATDLDNLALLCRRHHVSHHEGGWGFARGLDASLVPDPRRTVSPRGRIRRRRQSRPGRSDL
jgi:hypothetical protein